MGGTFLTSMCSSCSYCVLVAMKLCRIWDNLSWFVPYGSVSCNFNQLLVIFKYFQRAFNKSKVCKCIMVWETPIGFTLTCCVGHFLEPHVLLSSLFNYLQLRRSKITTTICMHNKERDMSHNLLSKKCYATL